MLPFICLLTIWAISPEFCRKPYILEADDFLGACYRKAITPQSYGLFPPKRSLAIAGCDAVVHSGAERL